MKIGALALSVMLIGAAEMVSASASHGWTLRTLHSFCAKQLCPDGQSSQGPVVQGADGTLYGTAYYGGVGYGTIFQLTPVKKKKWRFAVIYKFRCKQPPNCNDAYPLGKLVLDSSGNLYGTTAGAGDGMVFELQPNADHSSWTLLDLHSFAYGEATQPTIGGLSYRGESDGLVYDGVSPLYGMTQSGGEQGGGTLYQVQPTGDGKALETILYNFCSQQNCTDGIEPHGGLFVDSHGDLYGTTASGGTGTGWFGGPGGVVFKLSRKRGTWTETVLYDFCLLDNCPDGKYPAAAPTMDAAGNLYGTAHDGGSHSNGVVYKLSHAGDQWAFTVIHDFCSQDGCADGWSPMSPVTIDAAGNVFGTTTGGGAGFGVVFSIDPDFNVVHAFDGSDGQTPLTPVILNSSGALFGTTYDGGDYYNGTVFELSR